MIMRYTFIDEKTGKKLYETNDSLLSYGYSVMNNYNVNNVIRIIITEKYVISTYKNDVTLYTKKEI